MKKLLALCTISLLSFVGCTNYGASGFNAQKGLINDGATSRYDAVQIKDLQADILKANAEELNADFYEMWFGDRTTRLTDAIRPR